MAEWSQQQLDAVRQAVEAGVVKYIEQRRQMVPEFVERNYSMSGAFELNKKAFGLDMLKTPANILWTPPYFLLSQSGRLVKKLSNNRFGNSLTELPAGFKTDVEREVAWRIHTELLELPFDDESRKFERNSLFETILEQPELAEVFADSFHLIASIVDDEKGLAKLQDNLASYVDSRKAAAELSSVLVSVASGYVANKGVNLGALSLGSTLATSIAYHSAVSSFAFGNTLGALYYSVVPVTATKATVLMSTGGVAVLLGIVASYTGMFTDPLQKSLGWHDKKLHKLLDGIEGQLTAENDEAVSYKDGYVARVLDLADVLLSVTSKLR